jgi:DeoR family transcriptional regulator, glycerol-3-phosphate regulon repressor
MRQVHFVQSRITLVSLFVRQAEILEIAKAEGRVLVDDLITRFNVTPQTLRKDLNDLCERALLIRIHGGAVYSSGTENLEYNQRRQIASGEKAAIGRAAADLIPDGASLFINIGTTTEAVSEALVRHRNLLIVTNNINVANRLRIHEQFEVLIAGGTVRPSDGGIVGGATVDFVKQFRVDYAVIGTSAIGNDGALLDFDLREVKVTQAIIENAKHVILVADQSKFERSAPVYIASLNQIDTFVTDHCPNEEIRRLCADNGVNLIELSHEI